MYCKVSEGHLRLRVIFGVDHIEVRLIPSELISTKNVGWSSYNTTFLGVLGKKIPDSFSSFDLQLRLSRWRFRVASLHTQRACYNFSQPSIVLILIKYVNVVYVERGSPSDEGDIGGLSDHTEVRSIQK